MWLVPKFFWLLKTKYILNVPWTLTYSSLPLRGPQSFLPVIWEGSIVQWKHVDFDFRPGFKSWHTISLAMLFKANNLFEAQFSHLCNGQCDSPPSGVVVRIKYTMIVTSHSRYLSLWILFFSPSSTTHTCPHFMTFKIRASKIPNAGNT